MSPTATRAEEKVARLEPKGSASDSPTAASTQSAPKSLVAKLTEVMAGVGRIQKRGRNEFHKYDYATEADIVEAIRGQLAERAVLLTGAVEDVTREPVGEKGQVLTTLRMRFTFHDGQSGETLERTWAGAGTDKEDKGLYKAMTGAEKYFLLKTFLIPTGDDPEREEKDTEPDGYTKWLNGLEDVAPEGYDRLVDVINQGPEQFRALLRADHRKWNALKAKAEKK